MKLVKVDNVWVKPEKIIMVREVLINPFNKDNHDTWTEVVLEGSHPEEHPGNHMVIIDEPNIIHTYLPLDEVVAIINGGIE